MDIKVFYHDMDFEKSEFVDFLHKHLGKYGDEKKLIEQAIDYAMDNEEGKGGFIVGGYLDGQLVGCVVINDTAMKGYIAQHMLVYIAVHRDYRGKGLGRKLLDKVVELCSGNIALHVEYDNPARFLYRRLGFKSKYAEMRYEQKGERERQKEMEARMMKNYQKNPKQVMDTIAWLDTLDFDDIDSLEAGFKEYLNKLVLWATDWEAVFEDRNNKLTQFSTAFANLINLPYEQQVLLNRIQKEFYQAIETVVESSDWDFAWEEFLILMEAAKNVKKKIDSGEI